MGPCGVEGTTRWDQGDRQRLCNLFPGVFATTGARSHCQNGAHSQCCELRPGQWNLAAPVPAVKWVGLSPGSHSGFALTRADQG